MKREIFCLDCVIGLVVGALLGVVVSMIGGQMMLGWVLIDAVIGLVVAGGVSALVDGASKTERTTEDMLDAGGVGAMSGFLIGYICLTISFLTQSSGSVFFRDGYFVGFAFASVVVALCAFIIGAFVRAVYSRLFQNK